MDECRFSYCFSSWIENGSNLNCFVRQQRSGTISPGIRLSADVMTLLQNPNRTCPSSTVQYHDREGDNNHALLELLVVRLGSRVLCLSLRRLRCKNRLPVQNCIPQHTLVAAVHIAVHGIEVEADDVSLADGHVEDRRASNQIVFSPGLPAH